MTLRTWLLAKAAWRFVEHIHHLAKGRIDLYLNHFDIDRQKLTKHSAIRYLVNQIVTNLARSKNAATRYSRLRSRGKIDRISQPLLGYNRH